MICLRNTPKYPPKAPDFCARWPLIASNDNLATSWATWRKMQSGHLTYPQPPYFGGFHR